MVSIVQRALCFAAVSTAAAINPVEEVMLLQHVSGVMSNAEEFLGNTSNS